MKCFSLLLALLLCCASGCAPAGQVSRTGDEAAVDIRLKDGAVTVDGAAASTDAGAAVYVGGSIIYYRDGTDETYGEGTEADMHTAAEAATHTVVTITKPGTYRLSGSLSAGQICVDLGEGAKEDPAAVVKLLLDGANVTCTVAPALIFYNVYECDEGWMAYDAGAVPDYKAGPDVDTSAAGANVVLVKGSQNSFTGSHVARIYKEGTTKKLHKYDGAFYSKMSMNIWGDDGDDSGVLNIVGDSEGLDTELHLTVQGGTVNVHSQDDAINVNEDGVSVFTMNGGSLTVNGGNGDEGDGIDSNGYLVVNGGTLLTCASDHSPDGGLDADGGIFLNGGTVAAFGVRNDAAEQNSKQVYLELTPSRSVSAGSALELRDEAGSVLWSAAAPKAFQNLTLSLSALREDGTYSLYVDGTQTDYTQGFGPMGGGRHPEGMEPPEGFDPAQRPERPSDIPEPPEGFDPGQRPERPGDMPEPPEGFDPDQRHDGTRRPKDRPDAAPGQTPGVES